MSKLGRVSVGHSLRPCLGQGASQGEESVLADSGREGEITAWVGRVRSLDFLSILRECSSVPPHLRTIEVFACQYSFSAKLNFNPRLVIQCGMSQWCRLCLSLALWRIPAARKRRHPRPRFRVKPYSLHKLRRVPNFPARPMSSPHQGRVLGLALRRIHVPGRGLVPPEEDSLGCQADRRSRDRWGPRIPQAGTCAPR